mmetsp:Transcript_27397/g.88047  ORF Transcript_27397/g.88047 Transcript_27397/m.88047 type:complete len:286 (-) Transcript_27397:157-1014(-)
MVHDEDGAHDLVRRARLLAWEVGGVAHHKVGARRHLSRAHAHRGAILVEQDLIHVRVEHEDAALDGAQAGEALRQAAEAVQRVQVRRPPVALQRVRVQLACAHRVVNRLLQVVVAEVQRQRVAGEVARVVIQTKAAVHLVRHHARRVLHRVGGVRATVVRILLGGHPLEEVAELALLEEAHQRCLERLHLRGGDLEDGLLAPLEHVGAVHILEVEVVVHARVQQHAHQLAISHDELGNEIHVVKPVVAQALEHLRRWVCVPELAVQIGEVQRRRLAAIVAIPIHD